MTRMTPFDVQMMESALALARRGQGHVEPNPMVGAVMVSAAREVVGQGFHEKFGGPHAEVHALAQAGAAAQGGTLYVTLEPCCHHGKTPPCTEAVIRAGVARVVAATQDPFPAVAGAGFGVLRRAGVAVEVGLLEAEAKKLNAPFIMRVTQGRPWVIAKWAMSLDGKIATASGESKWITGEAARAHAHQTRGRVDGILVGVGTVLADDPLLTSRPPGPRVAARIVLDRRLRTPLESQLVRTARQAPVLLVHAAAADPARRQALAAAGCECWPPPAGAPADQLAALLRELGTQRSFTNLLVEGGPGALGSFLEAGCVDEAHCYLAPKLVGGAAAPGPFGGAGVGALAEALRLEAFANAQPVGDDLFLQGRVKRPAS